MEGRDEWGGEVEQRSLLHLPTVKLWTCKRYSERAISILCFGHAPPSCSILLNLAVPGDRLPLERPPRDTLFTLNCFWLALSPFRAPSVPQVSEPAPSRLCWFPGRELLWGPLARGRRGSRSSPSAVANDVNGRVLARPHLAVLGSDALFPYFIRT